MEKLSTGLYTTRKQRKILTIGLLTSVCVAIGFISACSFSLPLLSDSTHDNTQKKSRLSSNVRLHSMGFFAFGGRLVSDFEALDANVVYERKNWNAFLFKVVDLYDIHSPNNFILAMVYRKFTVGQRITITPYAGCVIEQTKRFADESSDFASIINSQFKVSRHFTLDHTVLLSNLALAPSHRDWVNRMRLIFDSGHYNITWWGWHNNQVLDHSSYYSSALSASYNKIKLSDNLNLSTGITGFKMIQTSDEEKIPKKNGLLFTIALLVN